MKNKLTLDLDFKKHKLMVIIIVIITSILLIGFLYYQSQRPNYRDLEKAYNELQIPSDWMRTDTYKVTGYKGFFCFNAGMDETCPALDLAYKINPILDPGAVARAFVALNHLDVKSNSCSEEKITCRVTFMQDGVSFDLYIESTGKLPVSVKIISSVNRPRDG